ncbi:MAG: 2-amino-4-hydroxy-6-hydroxymethyldihydropteridine diphosphokinase [Ignavibacteriales bacterium]|nr:2-amino-4-hydroxy-6-hydroxymethyldihydropteridine diphosphokinase [Ignavibacteriales bacterium]
MTENIFLGLGSNKGDRLEFIKTAIRKIREDKESRIVAISSVYESEPYGNKSQNCFLNAVVKIKSERSLTSLCQWIKNLEKEIGRIPGEKWGPREIDIDLLFFSNLIHKDDCLQIPHKEILMRDFVVVPMQEIVPEFEHPIEKIKMKDIKLNDIEKLIFKKYNLDLSNL